jgi:hypothetical protein
VLTVELTLQPVARNILFEQPLFDVHLYALASRPRWVIDVHAGSVTASYWLDDGTCVPARQMRIPAGATAESSTWPHADFVLRDAGHEPQRVDPFLWHLSCRDGTEPRESDEALEVHYVGRAVNAHLTYNARHRFVQGHHALEALEAELLSERPNRLVYVLLGRVRCFEERAGKRAEIPLDREIVWGLEAMMIRRFEPSHNASIEDAWARNMMGRYETVEVDLLTPALRLSSTGCPAWGRFTMSVSAA